jgi:hypothetical protein
LVTRKARKRETHSSSLIAHSSSLKKNRPLRGRH